MTLVAADDRSTWLIGARRAVPADLVSAAEADPMSLVSHRPEWVAAMVALGRGSDASRSYSFADGRRFVIPMLRTPLGLRSFGEGWGIGGACGAELDVGTARSMLADLGGLPVPTVHLRTNPLQAAVWRRAAGGRATIVERHAHVVDLSGGEGALWKGLSKQCRSGIRQAEKSPLEIDHASDGRLVPEFLALYAAALDRWAHEQHEPRLLSAWRAARRDPTDKWSRLSAAMPGRCRVWIARLDGVAVAGSIVTIGNDAHETRRAIDRAAAGRTHAGRLLAWRAMQDSVASGCRHHHLGDSGTSAGLSQFKESFGARRIAYPELRLERVPLTAVDRLARRAVKRVVGFRDLGEPTGH